MERLSATAANSVEVGAEAPSAEREADRLCLGGCNETLPERVFTPSRRNEGSWFEGLSWGRLIPGGSARSSCRWTGASAARHRYPETAAAATRTLIRTVPSETRTRGVSNSDLTTAPAGARLADV